MKVGIVGAGSVGSATAFLLSTSGVADEIVLVNRTLERATAEAADISHALPINGFCSVRSGNFSDLENFDAIVITCGAKRGSVGKNRLELLQQNIETYVAAIRDIERFSPLARIIVVTNPVDVLAGITSKISNFSDHQVISTGTLLDTSRFTNVLANYFHVSENEVFANVFGEHGNSQVLIWSSATICGIPIVDFAKERGIEFSESTKNFIEKRTKFAADDIIRGKQSTYYGIAGSVTKICKALKNKYPTDLNISIFHGNFENIGNIFLSTPTKVSSSGCVHEEVSKIGISKSEQQSLVDSARIIYEHTEFAIQLLQ